MTTYTAHQPSATQDQRLPSDYAGLVAFIDEMQDREATPLDKNDGCREPSLSRLSAHPRLVPTLTCRSGRVPRRNTCRLKKIDLLAPDGSVLWLQSDGTDRRRLFLRSDVMVSND